jgi:tRNA(fMet)-specific endonuclease VapC
LRYILDTNTCIFALKRQGEVVSRLRALSPADVAVTIITVAELWFGARKSRRPVATRREIDAFLAPIDVMPFDHAAAEAYADIRFALERRGRPIGERDQIIASIALARRLPVVTHNLSELSRVPGLRCEDWL